ncbi:uncharacterized protein LTR77_010584 [Saxophila tyrrhenica]|uniref:Xylanolytic transcriptional activator regulatory domain-containing protein n=1 Tax=Saxophila tyrrhenica TaxID=1690608 RepID=A0AAV9NV45_9PEZI|nr:hypothetical protein LTR77_010584 [Saxophila tyrrhenica]
MPYSKGANGSNTSAAPSPRTGPDGTSRTSSNTTPATKRAKFISDLIPESTLLNRPVPSTTKQPNDDIGVWVDRSTWDNLLKTNPAATTTNHDSPLATTTSSRSGQRPHSAVLGPLIDVYFTKIHPLLPLLSEPDFRSAHAAGHIPEPLVHAMCLAAAKDPSATPHLRLSDSSTTLPPRQFCTILHASVTGSLRAPVRFEKVTLIRTLALTSLHNEGPEGAEEASLLLSQAMHHAQTLGIHLGQQTTNPPLSSEDSSNDNDLQMKRLFWCLWSLDRLSGAINGRPLIMSDVDIAIEPFAPCESGFPAFEAWLKIASILNRVIDLYRPGNDEAESGWEGEWPVLEELLDSVHGWDLSPSILATLHLFYLTVGILSHRTRGVRELPQAKGGNLRQRLNAIEIIRMMSDPSAPALHPFPLLPYSVSLALSVSYQFLRQAQLSHQQTDAHRDFRTCVSILQSLRRTWSSADVMTTLAKKVLDELDRATDLGTFRIRRRKPGDKDEKDLIPPPTACHHGVGAVQTLVGSNGDTPQQREGVANAAMGAAGEAAGMGQQDGWDLFDNMDDVFGTFLDPNYPMNLDDLSFVDDLTPFDWNAEVGTGGVG